MPKLPRIAEIEKAKSHHGDTETRKIGIGKPINLTAEKRGSKEIARNANQEHLAISH
jgi:hypothetical protein